MPSVMLKSKQQLSLTRVQNMTLEHNHSIRPLLTNRRLSQVIRVLFFTLLLLTVTRVNPVSATRLRLDPRLPASFIVQLHNLLNTQQPENVEIVVRSDDLDDKRDADCAIEMRVRDMTHTPIVASFDSILLPVAKFYSVPDTLSEVRFYTLWNGSCTGNSCTKIYMTEETEKLLTFRYGPPSENHVRVVAADKLLESVWDSYYYALAIIPFDELEPRWKPLRLVHSDGLDGYPLDADFDPNLYPWRFTFDILDENRTDDKSCEVFSGLRSNLDPDKLTTVTLTGTTALVRRLAEQIELNGINYPIVNIRDRLLASDILHVSNESSFFDDCPPGIPLRSEPRFCSPTGYFEILKNLGVDIVELTGNHVLDWGEEPFLNSLELFADAGMKTYGGGVNIDDAKKPLRIEHNGNKIAFLGCNTVGPETVFASKTQSGAVPCDLEKMSRDIETLLEEGYQPIVTFQHVESDFYTVSTVQAADFYHLANAGAVILSGSQAHIPQGFAFIGPRLIHFGLGNFLFDQTSLVERDSFIDHHVFYQGKHIATTLDTIRLSDAIQPDWLTGKDRDRLLNAIFEFSFRNRLFPKKKKP